MRSSTFLFMMGIAFLLVLFGMLWNQVNVVLLTMQGSVAVLALVLEIRSKMVEGKAR
ncbi:hypothetical protein MM326_02910 [Alkalihalobacillus sp. LMS6]|uniref:hypothetical protein n=1 Tax=Alkalihalobacillus sp. LMS6 TaxID=2924034 RepID=UPI0020D01213|nr:hypothetical protein [Alkalihalobacillus sp. LMS6]UTR07000.1 hypothetical protein MM326_02910 [Alkalihalobacillus sp. LMS6]